MGLTWKEAQHIAKTVPNGGRLLMLYVRLEAKRTKLATDQPCTFRGGFSLTDVAPLGYITDAQNPISD